jgi:hypothetical protein
LLDTVKSFLSMFNIQNPCHTLRSLALRVRKTSDRLSKIMLLLDAIVTCYVTCYVACYVACYVSQVQSTTIFG